MALKPVVLCILDGWGLSDERTANAPVLANTPNFDRIWAEGPRAQLQASGEDVGLPTGQMGNSEVGHTNIGAGRIVYHGEDHVLIDTGGVGYVVYCTDRVRATLPGPGEAAALFTDLLVREDR